MCRFRRPEPLHSATGTWERVAGSCRVAAVSFHVSGSKKALRGWRTATGVHLGLSISGDGTRYPRRNSYRSANGALNVGSVSLSDHLALARQASRPAATLLPSDAEWRE